MMNTKSTFVKKVKRMSRKAPVRILALVLMVALVMNVTSIVNNLNVFAGSDTSGQCGKNLTWNLDINSGEFVVSGSGNMYTYDYFKDSRPWYENRHYITKIIFNGNITSIGAWAFCGSNVESVILPKSVKSIEWAAFEYCYSVAAQIG